MIQSPFRNVDTTVLPLVPRRERRTNVRHDRVPTREVEPSSVSLEPPIYLIEVEQARRRMVRRLIQALTIASSGGLAWLVGNVIGGF